MNFKDTSWMARLSVALGFLIAAALPASAQSLVQVTNGTAPATSITATSAVLNGFVRANLAPGGVNSSNYFEIGVEGGAVSLNPRNHSHVSLPNRPWVSLSGTWEAWVNPRAYNSWGRVFDLADGAEGAAPSENLVFALSQGTTGVPYADFRAGTTVIGNLAATNSPLPLNQWTHLALTLSNRVARLYVNGSLRATTTLTADMKIVSRARNFIGRSTFAGDQPTDASFDEARIWNVVRSEEQIRDSMNRQLVGNESGLRGYWRFDEASGATATNFGAEGAAGNATLVNLTERIPSPVALYSTTSAVVLSSALSGRTVAALDGSDSITVDATKHALYNRYPMTIAARIRVAPGSGGQILGKYVSGSLNGWQLALSDGATYPYYFKSGFSNAIWDGDRGNFVGGAVDDGLWHHVAFVIEATGARLYVDGELREARGWRSPISLGPPTTTTPLVLMSGVNGSIADAAFWNDNLSGEDIAAMAAGAFGSTPPKTNTMVGWWKLTEGSGQPLNQISTNGHGAFVSGGVGPGAGWADERDFSVALSGLLPGRNYHVRSVSAAGGVRAYGADSVFTTPNPGNGSAIRFTGVGRPISLPNLATNMSTDEFTIEFWQNVSEVRDNVSFAMNQDIPGSRRLLAHVPFTDGKVYFDFGNANEGNVAGYGRLSYTPPESIVGRWNHFAFVVSRSGNFTRIYRNGVLEAQMARVGTFPRQFGNLQIGGLFDDDAQGSFKGDMDEIRVWNTARSAAQVADAYNRRAVGDEPGLLACLRFDEGSGRTVRDASTNNYHANMDRYPLRVPSSAPVDLPVVVSSDASSPLNGPPVFAGNIKAAGTNTSYWVEYGTTANFAGPSSNIFRVFQQNQSIGLTNFAQINYAALPDLASAVSVLGFDSRSSVPLTGFPTATRFASQFLGQFFVAQPGSYSFTAQVDDGGILYIDGVQRAIYDGLGGVSDNVSATVFLQPGYHTVEVRQFNNLGPWASDLLWSGPGIPRQRMPAAAFQTVPVLNDRTTVASLVGATNGLFQQSLANPTYGATTYYRVVASNEFGVVTGPVRAFAVPSPQQGLAATFDGSQSLGAFVNVPETEVTHEMWFRTTSPNGGLFSATDLPGYYTSYAITMGVDRNIELVNGNIRARLWNEQVITSSGLNLNDGQWHHVAHVFGASVGGQRLYVDGVERASGSKTNSDFVGQSYINLGVSVGAAQPYFTGDIDEFRVWSRTLSAAEIQQRYRDRVTGSEAGLLGVFRFDDGEGYSAVNSVQGGFNMFYADVVNPYSPLTRTVSGARFIQKPLVNSANPFPVLALTATFRGNVHPLAKATTAWFEWVQGTNLLGLVNSTNSSQVNRTPLIPVNAIGTFTNLSLSVSNLQAGGLYTYRLVAFNADGTNFGSPIAFSTPSIGCGWPIASVIQSGSVRFPRHAVDAAGNVFASGIIEGATTFRGSVFPVVGSDIVVAKANRGGDWMGEVVVPCSGNALVSSIQATADGGAVVAGHFTQEIIFGTNTFTVGAATNSFVAKLSSDGQTWLWAVRLPGGTGNAATSLNVDTTTGDLLVGGHFSGANLNFGVATVSAAGPTDTYLARLAGDGSAWRWASSFGGGGASVSVSGVAVGPAGRYYAVGSFSGTATFGAVGALASTASDFWVASLNRTNGAVLAANRGGGNGADAGLAISTDGTNSVFIAGRVSDAATYGSAAATFGQGASVNLFIARLSDSLGLAPNSVARVPSPATTAALAFIPGGRLLVGGEFNGALSLGNLPTPEWNGGTDVFVAAIDTANLSSQSAWRWVRPVGGLLNESLGSISVDRFGDYLVSGTFQGIVTFGYVDLAVASPNGADLFLAKLSPRGTNDARFEHNTIEIGQPIPVPGAAVDPGSYFAQGGFDTPDWDVLEDEVPGSANNPTTRQNAFLFNNSEGRLHAVRPLMARIRFPMNKRNATNDFFVTCIVRCVWPEDSRVRRHIATVPVNVEPQRAASEFTFFGYEGSRGVFTTGDGAVAGLPENTGQRNEFNATRAGYSVIAFQDKTRPLGQSGLYPFVFEVVKTVLYSEVMTNTTAEVGTTLLLPDHFDPEGKSGWIMFTNVPVDLVGADRAHDRPTRMGSIIPVNTSQPGANTDPLVVVWSHTNAVTRIGWPDTPVLYSLAWPTNTDRIVLAKGNGYNIQPTEVVDTRVYSQTNRALPGFNPNDEHAFITGSLLFALRDDVIPAEGPRWSQPYVLLKYREPQTTNWSIHAIRVQMEGPADDEKLFKQGIAGQTLGIIPPLGRPELFYPSNAYAPTNLLYRAYDGKIWIRGAGAGNSTDDVIVNFYYRVLPEFYLPGVAPGTFVPWLANNRADGNRSRPIDVTYRLSWPTEAPFMRIGDTFINPRNGIPGVRDMASARVVYDQTEPSATNQLGSALRLFDPLSDRIVQLRTSAEIGRGEFTTGAGWTNLAITDPVKVFAGLDLRQRTDGKMEFGDLPWVLRSRLLWDPINRYFIFRGLLDESEKFGGQNNPLLLINVLSPRERDTILSFSSKVSDSGGRSDFVSAVKRLFEITRNPNHVDADGNGTIDITGVLVGLISTKDGAGRHTVVSEQFKGGSKALSTAFGTGESGYITIIENDDATLNLPVNMYVFKIEGGPVLGDVKVLPGDNVFDERLTLRHSSDFGAQPERFEFEWFYKPYDSDYSAGTNLPIVDPVSGNIVDNKGFQPFVPRATDRIDITFGADGGDPTVVLSDNWVIMRYRGYVIGGQTNWSDWSGVIGGGQAQLAEGWIKRVRSGFNAFDSRTRDFHASPVATYASMVQQAGARYEGPVALNPTPENINKIGLIAAYQTILDRAQKLSIDNPVYQKTTNYAVYSALLNAATYLQDLYVIHGNEAMTDAADPTIGFGTASGEYGTLAPTIFNFQNQLDSLLEEELVLLRGRDSRSATVRRPPVYNRLFWNFTQGDGEVAYVTSYNISDRNQDGFVDETDASTSFPMGHGDAWGHYLTALKQHYSLLRNPAFEWSPRTEAVSLAGVPVEVDYLDERKFAAAAAAKAKAGAEIVDLTYRNAYVEDPDGQWQGYKDTDTDRAWGLSEWGRRAGQGAYFDWVTANAILPAVDPNTNHTGIQKIDRTTVGELDQIISQFVAVQSQVDKADAGLNPVGVAAGAVPFDIDPNFLEVGSGIQGQMHFDQIYKRTEKALANALAMFDHANANSQNLRKNQDTLEEFEANIRDQERDYKNRLIEIFGYPYGGDIGPGKTYPSGYDGPDLYHFMYVDATPLSGLSSRTDTTLTGYFKPFDGGDGIVKRFFSSDAPTGAFDAASNDVFSVEYPFASGRWGFAAPASWASRRAPGKLQNDLQELLRAEGKLRQAFGAYKNHSLALQDSIDILRLKHDFGATKIGLRTGAEAVKTALSVAKLVTKGIAVGFERAAETIDDVGVATVEGIPKVLGLASDALAPIRGVAKGVTIVSSATLKGAASASEILQMGYDEAKENTDDKTALIIEGIQFDFELREEAKALEKMFREESQLRLDVYDAAEALNGALGNYQASLAEGLRLIDERIAFRKRTAATVTDYRYQDATFRISRNDAIQKYRAAFDLASRYTYLLAKAYDFETCLLSDNPGAGKKFLTDIVRQRSLGQFANGLPIAGRGGLADSVARLGQNFDVYRGQLGFNNPQIETGRFGLRSELFRISDDASSDATWREQLRAQVIPDLWDFPQWRRFCRPFANETDGSGRRIAQPAIVIRFPSTITSGLNYFGWPLGGGDNSYDSSIFATKIRSAGVWFTGYDGKGMSLTPRIYLVPAGQDVLRSPSGNLDTRSFYVVDQKLPAPFPIGYSDLQNPSWIPWNDSLSDRYGEIRRFSSFRAYHDAGLDPGEMTTDTRLVGRSVWNTDWMLIIPGATLLNNPNTGIDTFINSVTDIKVFFQTYAFSGN